MEFTDGKRPPRPTIAVLKKLPRESFPAQYQRKQIDAGHFQDLRLYEIEHPLLEDARKYFPNTSPSLHKAATKSAQRPVYEVRSHSGAAWRGAVIRDDHGDPWLVYVDRHDQFHSRVAEVMSASSSSPGQPPPLHTLLPRPVEYKLRRREEAEIINLRWRADILNRLIRGIAIALLSNADQEIILPTTPSGAEGAVIALELEHDQPPKDDSGPAEALNETQSSVSFVLRCPRPHGKATQAAIQEIIPFLQPDPSYSTADYSPKGELVLWITVSQAKLTQLVAASELPDPREGLVFGSSKPDHLHYVFSTQLATAFVMGRSIRAVCGCWFVPSRDEQSDLPLCPKCEEEQPTAQRALDLIRSSLPK